MVLRFLTILAAVVSAVVSPGGGLSDFSAANATGPCFLDRDELKTAVDEYIAEDCAANSTCTVGKAYGWPMNGWCVSNVTDMSELFLEAEEFNSDLSAWDVSRVTDMNDMFRDARAFNCSLSEWDGSRVTDMSGMFWDARSFDGNLSAWDVSRVSDISNLFKRSAFSGELGSIATWDVSQVTNMDSVFQRAAVFNGDISSWNVSRVTDMSKMFQRALAFNGDLSAWDVSRVTDMGGIFYEAKSFRGDGLSAWDVSKTGEPCSPCDFAASCFSDACAFRDSKTGEWSDLMAHCNFGAVFCEFCFPESSCYGFGSIDHNDGIVDTNEQSEENNTDHNDGIVDTNEQSEQDQDSIDHSDGIVDTNEKSEGNFYPSKGPALVTTSGLVLALLGMII